MVSIGGPGRFMKKFFGDSCLPQCGDGEKGFSMLVASDADCPTDISKGNRKEFKDVAVRPKDFCEAEVSHNGLEYFCESIKKIVFVNEIFMNQSSLIHLVPT